MSTRRILIVGAGGREHALAWRLASDPEGADVWVAPGNDGMSPPIGRLAVSWEDPPELIRAAREHAISLVVIGPEAPLAAGVADALSDAGLRVFGPSRAAARLESSKWFAKRILAEAAVRTARAECFMDAGSAVAALARFGPPWVIKADGLASGKGVVVTERRDEAEAFLAACLSEKRLGQAGTRVVIEEFLAGEEASVIAVCDGRDFVMLPAARDHKRALDGDLGPNTGGMGAYAPSPIVDAALEARVGREVFRPVLDTLARRGTPFRGALYCGLMIGQGEPSVVEFNARFGDPETQATMPLLSGSLGKLLESAADGALDREAVGRRAEVTVAVALVDEGYPERAVGGAIRGLDAWSGPDRFAFFASGRRAGEAWEVAGGRAVHLVARAADRETARVMVYDGIDRLSGTGWRCRHDIAASGAAGSDAAHDCGATAGLRS